MDQPYSRIADALLDYQYWSPNDPQKTPYDDTGWTFPEVFATAAVRVTDVKVLDVPVDPVTDSVRALGGVTGAGAVFAINANGDNALTMLRYRLKTADIQVAEEPFTAAGKTFARGSFIVRAADLDREARDLGLSATALPAAPTVKTHPARAARVAILHTWVGTQTEGWWREAFDFLGLPYDYISVQDVAKSPNLNAKYDVILFPPVNAGVSAIIDGMPMWRNPMPWKHSTLTPNIGTYAETDDIPAGVGIWRVGEPAKIRGPGRCAGRRGEHGRAGDIVRADRGRDREPGAPRSRRREHSCARSSSTRRVRSCTGSAMISPSIARMARASA